MSKTELEKWKEENEKLSVALVYSFNFVDFEDVDVPTRFGASSTLPTAILQGTVEIEVDIELHFASFHDTLINPI